MDLYLFTPKNTLDQFTYSHSIEVSEISGYPDWNNFAVVANDSDFRLYCLKPGSSSTLYQFRFNDDSYELGYNCKSELEIKGVPDNANLATLNMLYDEDTIRLYFQDKNDPQLLYQFELDNDEFNFVDEIRISGLEGVIDRLPTAMLYANDSYHFFALDGAKGLVHQAIYDENSETYCASNSLSFSDSSVAISKRAFSMAYGDGEYFQYFLEPTEEESEGL